MPYKDEEKAREYNRRKKLEYYHKNPRKFNERRKKYKRTQAPKEKQKEYSARWYRKQKHKMAIEHIESGRLVDYQCQSPKCSITWRGLPGDKTKMCSYCKRKSLLTEKK